MIGKRPFLLANLFINFQVNFNSIRALRGSRPTFSRTMPIDGVSPS